MGVGSSENNLCLKITWHWGESGQSRAMPLEGYVSTGSSYTGLTKDQLLECAYRPLWVRVRCTLLVAYWTSWVAMLAGAITIILVTPKCSTPEPLQWWQVSTMYQIFSLSYQDGNRLPDGVGDIQGTCCCRNRNEIRWHSHSLQASGILATQEIPGRLWDSQSHYRVYSCSPVALIPRRTNLVHNIHSCS